jgi:hypothetical protein
MDEIKRHKRVIGRQVPLLPETERTTSRGRPGPLLWSRLGTARQDQPSSGNFGRQAGPDQRIGGRDETAARLALTRGARGLRTETLRVYTEDEYQKT